MARAANGGNMQQSLLSLLNHGILEENTRDVDRGSLCEKFGTAA